MQRIAGNYPIIYCFKKKSSILIYNWIPSDFVYINSSAECDLRVSPGPNFKIYSSKQTDPKG
jgi:hypothetical protein